MTPIHPPAGFPSSPRHSIAVTDSELAGQLVVAGDYVALGLLLFQKQIDPNIKSLKKSNSLLHAAFGYIDDHLKQQRVVYELVVHGADVNVHNVYGMTPLDVAVQRTRPNPTAIAHLLRFGAQITPAAQQRAMRMAQSGERWLLEALRKPCAGPTMKRSAP